MVPNKTNAPLLVAWSWCCGGKMAVVECWMAWRRLWMAWGRLWMLAAGGRKVAGSGGGARWGGGEGGASRDGGGCGGAMAVSMVVTMVILIWGWKCWRWQLDGVEAVVDDMGAIVDAGGWWPESRREWWRRH
nr:hypothetical protein [Tanacetum cinerariifolium]